MKYCCKVDPTPRAEDQPQSIDVVRSWTICEGFSPSAPWGNQWLRDSIRDTTGTLISGSSDELVAEFRNRIQVELPDLKCLPTIEEIADLISKTGARKSEQEEEIIRQLTPGGLITEFMILIQDTKVVPDILNQFLLALLDEISGPIFHAKFHYNRIRSYQLFPQLTPGFMPLVKFPMHPSFPSGHSTEAHFIAQVFEDICGKNQSLGDLAWRIGVNREIAGVHYRSDTTGGKIMAEILINAARMSDAYGEQLDVVRDSL